MCKNYMKNNKCRFNSDCAYSHEENENNQTKLNEQFKLAMLKHEKDIEELNKEVNNLKNMINAMTLELVKSSYKHVSIAEKVDKGETKTHTVVKFSSSKKVFECDKCDYTCFKDITLKKHVNTVHPMTKNICKEDQDVALKANFYCDLCSFSCTVKTALKKHQSKEHDSQKTSEEVSKEKGQNIEQIEEALCSVCDICQQKFRNKKDLELHIEENHQNSEDRSANAQMHVCETCKINSTVKTILQFTL